MVLIFVAHSFIHLTNIYYEKNHSRIIRIMVGKKYSRHGSGLMVLAVPVGRQILKSCKLRESTLCHCIKGKINST